MGFILNQLHVVIAALIGEHDIFLESAIPWDLPRILRFTVTGSYISHLDPITQSAFTTIFQLIALFSLKIKY